MVRALLFPLDRARRHLYALFVKISRPAVTRREPRVVLFAIALISLGFTLVVAAPLWLLLLGPILLGVPHVVSDVRYLVVRPGLHRRWLLWAVIGGPLVWSALGGGVRAGLLATIGALLVARGRASLRIAGVTAVAALFVAVCWTDPARADLLFAHAHNFVAVALWSLWRRREGWLHLVPLALFAILSAALLLGAGEPDVRALPDSLALGLVPTELAWTGGRLIALYAFAQSVHYAVWLRLIPEEDRPRPTTRGFAASLAALSADMTPWAVAIAAAVMLGFGVYAAVDLVAARDHYLYFASFHGHLEIAAAALLFSERTLPIRAPGPTSPRAHAPRPEPSP